MKLTARSSASLPLPGNAIFHVVVGGASYKTTLADILDNAGDYLPRVDTQADLPVTVDDPAVDALYLVRESTGVWLVNRHPKGIYRRIANDGDLDDWEYWGDEQALADLFGSYQPLDSDLTAIAALTPSNDDVIQRKAGAWTNRTMAQLKTDLAIGWSDVSGKPATFPPVIGPGAGDAVAGNDSRLTNERVPTSAGLTSKFGTNKATLVDGDKLAALDSAASDAPVHLLWSLVKSTLKTYLDTLYQPLRTVLTQFSLAEADVASATTTDIGAEATDNVRITGTTTITGLGTVAAGTRRYVRFAGALTLTHNATSLILPGGANITTAANDRMIAVSLGSGNWLVVVYQKANGEAVVGGGGGGGRDTFDFSIYEIEAYWGASSGGGNYPTRNSAINSGQTLTAGGSADFPCAEIRSGANSGAGYSIQLLAAGSATPIFDLDGDHVWRCQWLMKTGSSVADVRIFFGVLNTGGTITPADGIFFRFDTSLGDTAWEFAAYSGSTATLASGTLGAIAANTTYTLNMWSTGDGVVRATVNGGTERTLSTGLTTERLMPSLIFTNDTTADRRVQYGRLTFRVEGVTP